MNIHDLRIDNKIKSPDGIETVLGIHHDGIYVKYHMFIPIEYIEPIVLTESILPNCGFELLDTDGENWDSSFDDPNDESKFAKVYGVNGLELAVSHTGEIYTIYRCVDNYYERADKKIEYLHDLQNYYYVMNKKELEVSIG